MGDCGGYPGLPIGTILATKLEVSWPFGSVEEAKNGFLDLGLWIGTIIAIFDLQLPWLLPTKF